MALLSVLPDASFTGGSERHTVVATSFEHPTEVKSCRLSHTLSGSDKQKKFSYAQNSSNCSFASCTLGHSATRSKYCDLRGPSNHQDLQDIGLGQNGTRNRCHRDGIGTIVTNWCDESPSQSKENVRKHLSKFAKFGFVLTYLLLGCGSTGDTARNHDAMPRADLRPCTHALHGRPFHACTLHRHEPQPDEACLA